MKSLKYLLSVAGLFCMLAGKAQTGGADLRLEPNSLAGLPAVVHLNDFDTFSIAIFNDSASTFTGIITIAGAINGDTIVADTVQTHTLYYPKADISDTILPHSFIVRSLGINVNNPPFIAGSSGVVIWPIVVGSSNSPVIIPDSVSKIITVLYPAGIDEMSARGIKIYMNGFQLVIQNKGDYQLKNIQLYDIAGNLLQQKDITVSGEVSIDEYAAGVYFAEINFADNTRAVVKVVNTR